MPPSRAVGTEYRYAVEQAIRYRRPVAIMIDEAQHLGKIPSGRRLLDQLDVVKSIANQTKTVHVLFGTYDLLAFRNLNGQLSRRSIDVHLARYRAEDSEDRQTFINVVRSFEKELPFEDPSDLVSDWEFLYERSLGCVGILKEWLVRAATVASRKGARRLTRANLESQALCVAQCEQLHAETTDGELKLNEQQPGSSAASRETGFEHPAATEVRSEAASPVRPNSGDRASGFRHVTLLDKWMQMQPLFDSWSLSSPPVPPRSQLYSLEPIGVGTALVESLTGYVARLAEAHSVSVGDLVGRVLSDVPNPKGAIIPPGPKLADSAGMDFEFAAMRLTALQTVPKSGYTLWKPRRAAVTYGISLSFRSAAHFLTICFIGTGRGACSVSNNGG